ncbi:flagellar assembly protein FliH [Oceanobacillus bengalensis]|uniref:flagellar assembly protein FliH n=1 Tax=Oceanobacillus bengalensis TaxID=1435466 RepID=UPI0016045D2F|nr:flagellar assembly protein FliH [Oceanobacillus bengalensis]
MSNFHKSVNKDKKVIAIKPIDFLIKEKQLDPSSYEEEYQSIEDKIAKAIEQLTTLETQQKELLQATKTQIEKEKSNWQTERAKWIEEAKEEGYKSGYLSGQQDSISEYKGLLEKANTITEQATKDYHTTLDKSETTILQLSISIAEKVMKQKITDDPSVFSNLVKTVIKSIKDKSMITIYTHPDNYEMILEQKDELIRLLENDTKLSIYVKDELSENACIIEHPFGRVDASVDSQLEQIRNILLDFHEENKQ